MSECLKLAQTIKMWNRKFTTTEAVSTGSQLEGLKRHMFHVE